MFAAPSNADFAGAYLTGADFTNANVRGATFENVTLSGIDIGWAVVVRLQAITGCAAAGL